MELQQLAQAVVQVAIDAGQHALQEQTTPHVLKSVDGAQNTSSQFTADVDDPLVRYCREKVTQIDPLNGFWEEANPDDRIAGNRYWSIGRIDGAINYMRNMPEWTITISVIEVINNMYEVAPILGVVHAPALGLTYLAARGAGAIRIRRTPIGDKHEAIMPSTQAQLEGSVVCFGMSYFSEESLRALKTVAAIAGKPADIKRVGPASLDLCKVADGTYDAYFEPDLHSWDIPGVSAATVVVWEAQGSLRQWDGNAIDWFRSNNVVASNGQIIDELRPYLVDTE